MGLDTTHDCWHGSYGAFMRWRKKLAEVAGFGNLNDYEGFGGSALFDARNPLTPLLDHSDCDGEIPLGDLLPLAMALEGLLPALEAAGDGGGHIGGYADKTRTFIEGLRRAIE